MVLLAFSRLSSKKHHNMATPQPRGLYIMSLLDELEDRMTHERFYVGRERLRCVFDKMLKETEIRFEKWVNQKAIGDKVVPDVATKIQLHTQVLKNCFQKILDTIDLKSSHILDVLLSNGVISISDEESVKGREDRRGQNENLLGCLLGHISAEDFQKVLLPALQEDYPHLVDHLLAEMDRLETEVEDEKCVSCRVRDDVQVKRLAIPLLKNKKVTYSTFLDLRGTGLSNSSKWAELKSVQDRDIIQAMREKYRGYYQELMALNQPSLECRCEAVIETEEDVSVEEDGLSIFAESDLMEKTALLEMISDRHEEKVYRMNAKPRGVCLILNNNEIKGHVDRNWSVKDEEKLQKLFTKLEFDVISRRDLDADEMIEAAKEIASMDHRKYDAFVCCVLTYGNEIGFYGADGKLIDESQITSWFQPSFCPSLARKPKMFFIQANRINIGNKKEKGRSNWVNGYVAEDVDFVMAYCTSKFTNSFADSNGSIYIDALTEVLEKYSDSDDLLTCLRMVNDRISSKVIPCQSQLLNQVPAPMFTLTKELFLTCDPACEADSENLL